MTFADEQTEPRPEVLRALRESAKRGATVRELVRLLHARFGVHNLLPILWHFMKAFHLPLPAVLPIREWLGTTRDEEIDAIILPAIASTRGQWAPLDEEQNGPTWTPARDPGLTSTDPRS